jgi:hypothetical protein
MLPEKNRTHKAKPILKKKHNFGEKDVSRNQDINQCSHLIPKALTHLLTKRDTLNTTPKALLLLVHKT